MFYFLSFIATDWVTGGLNNAAPASTAVFLIKKKIKRGKEAAPPLPYQGGRASEGNAIILLNVQSK